MTKPKIRCEACGVYVGVGRLKAHNKSILHIRAVFKAREMPKYSIEQGMDWLIAQEEALFWEISALAGFDLDNAIGQMRVVWVEGNREPLFATIVPKWVSMAISTLHIEQSSAYIPNAAKSPHASDIAFLMKMSAEDQLVFQAELILTSATEHLYDGRAYKQVDREAARRTIRRWVSRGLGSHELDA